MTDFVSPWMNDDLAMYRQTVARFVESEMLPQDARWRQQHNVGHEIWRKAGALGLLCADVPAEYGGAGGDFRHEVVLYEELARRAFYRLRPGRAQHCRPLRAQPWHRSAEAPLPAAAGER